MGTTGMTSVWIGVDPGLQGAIAILTPDGVEITPMPVVPSSKGGRDQYDLPAIAELLDLAAAQVGAHRVLLTCEHMHALPPRIGSTGNCPACKQPVGGRSMGGSLANYGRGEAVMAIKMGCAVLGIPYQLVAPRTWQKWAHQGTSGDDLKQRSIMAAQRLFPGVSLMRTPRSRVPHDGCAEALLLAAWAQVALSQHITPITRAITIPA
jgi:hypothetical protein